jgi:hypothetical protein
MTELKSKIVKYFLRNTPVGELHAIMSDIF